MTEHSHSGHRRRNVLRAIGAGSVAALAGCLGGNGEDVEDWRTASLEDATSGESFRVADIESPTLVHTFAVNCLTCRSQQGEFVTLWGQRDDFEIVELSVDPNDSPEAIASHAEAMGLDWRLGVAPEPVVGSLVEEFGQVMSVSAQSKVVLECPDGTTATRSKVSSSADLASALEDTC